MSAPSYSIIFSEVTLEKIRDYQQRLRDGRATAGMRLGQQAAALDTRGFIQALLDTKLPCIFAESAITGNGSDWNADELSILGDINVAMPVTIFDNGTWSPDDPGFATHVPPIDGNLLFTPGALLQKCVPDLDEVTTDGKIDQAKYNVLIERRLLPLLAYANAQGKDAIVVLPGIGCGAFSGRFQGTVGAHLNLALQAMLQKYASQLPHIKAVHFDPHSQGTALEKEIGHLRYISAPRKLPQLSTPADFGYPGHTLYKLVAWDHVSWPGNDYFSGSRYTDDGMAGAATDSMHRLTGVQGRYVYGAYEPPVGFANWQDVAKGKKMSAAHILVTPHNSATCVALQDSPPVRTNIKPPRR